MVVLLVLLLLSNLWFGWAAGSSGSSNSAASGLNLGDILGQLQDTQKKKEETCAKVKSALASLATSKKWKVEADQYGIMSIELPNGESFVINKDCSKTFVKVQKGTLSPPQDFALASYPQGMIVKENVKFQVDVGLFRTLFLMLMYAAGIFWAVRTAQRLIAGDLTESFINFFIGFIIVATMYVLYRWMPA
jgi:hypothetical protein